MSLSLECPVLPTKWQVKSFMGLASEHKVACTYLL